MLLNIFVLYLLLTVELITCKCNFRNLVIFRRHLPLIMLAQAMQKTTPGQIALKLENTFRVCPVPSLIGKYQQIWNDNIQKNARVSDQVNKIP